MSLNRRLTALEGKGRDEITIIRQCPECATWTTDTRTPCGHHPLPPPRVPGEPVIDIVWPTD
jgi:hypothetical protein